MLIAGGLLLGLLVGVVYGLTGLNAIVLIPALVVFFGLSQHKATGTTIAMLLLPAGVFAFLKYWRAGQVDFKLAGLLALGFAIGGYFGGTLAQRISDVALRRGFAVVLILAAIRMLWK